MKLYPVPPEHAESPWALPYSIRSFVAQASSEYAACLYSVQWRGRVMGEDAYMDRCCDPRDDPNDETGWHNCHIVAGWTTGETTCNLWEMIAQLCETENERKFLHWYLRYARDRHFPMLIPQASVGIAERRRPDFVIFVPIQYWKYKKLAIQLDGGHLEDMAPADEMRDKEIAVHGYEVRKVRPEAGNYFEEVRRLVEEIDQMMQLAESSPWEAAIEIEVRRTETDQEVPF